MNILRETELIEYEVFRLEHAREASEVIGMAFAEDEPLAVARQIRSEDLAKSVAARGRFFAEECVSVIARFGETKELAGVVLAHDFTTYSYETTGPIGSLLTSLDDRYRGLRKISAGDFLHINMLAVSRKYRGRQIARSLVELCIEVARGRGFAFAVTEATNLASQRVMRENGFVDRYEILYDSFYYENKKPFESITEHPSIILMEKELIDEPVP